MYLSKHIFFQCACGYWVSLFSVRVLYVRGGVFFVKGSGRVHEDDVVVCVADVEFAIAPQEP